MCFPVVAFTRLFIALLRERRGSVLAQNGDVEALSHIHIRVRHGEPVLHRARVGGSEEVQVLPAGIENRLTRLAQAVRDFIALFFLEGIDVDLLNVGLGVERVGDPLRVRRPPVMEEPNGTVTIFGVNLLDGAAFEVDPVDRERVVPVADLLAVGRPARVVVETAAVELVAPGLTATVLRSDVKRVLAGSVREVGHRFPSGDHAGERSWIPVVWVGFRASPFSAGSVRMSPQV